MITNSFLNSIGKMSLQTKMQRFHGINPKLRYCKSNVFFNLPRFISEEMKDARKLNRIALNEFGDSWSNYTFKNATESDYFKLTDQSAEASFLRVKWVNPKDGKVYFLLKNYAKESGKQIVRILDESGSFIKEAFIPRKKIVVFEIDSGKNFSNINNLSHSELMQLFIKRYNPFVDIDIHFWKDKLHINDSLQKSLDNDVAAISCAFSAEYHFKPENKLKKFFNNLFHKRLKSNLENVNEQLNKYLLETGENMTGIPKNVRVFMAAGNDGVNSYNSYLSLKGIEGVGSLSENKKIADYSASRNSYFTQHYEQGDFPVIQVPEGFILTNSKDIDIPYKSNKFRMLPTLHGTSFSVSIRAAKVVLNQLMNGIL